MDPINETAMNAVLERCGESTSGVILRLAWQAGLKRQEIRSLTWGQVDLMEWKIALPERTVPIPMELAVFLAPLEETAALPVVRSQRTGEMLEPQTISHLARAALEEGGLGEVHLTDLRADCARRMLDRGEDWQAVARSTGMGAAALRRLGEVSTRVVREPKARASALEQMLEQEGPSPAGIAIALAWRGGLGLEDITALRWDQVPALSLDEETLALLDRGEKNGPYVLSTRTARPYDLARLSRLVRSAFIKGGLDDLTLRDLRQLRQGEAYDGSILDLAASREGTTARDLQEALSLSDTAVRRMLRRLTEQGKLVRMGLRYYLPGTVVPPQEQEKAILDYLAREGFAYRQDIARLLHISPAQCRPVLTRLVEGGKVKLEEQRYLLA